VKRIYILTLHRSGSTWLQNIIDSSPEVSFANDEINGYEPFRRNTADKYWKYGFSRDNFIKDYSRGKVFGSFFKKEEPNRINSTLYALDKKSEFWDFLVRFSCNFETRYFGFKYPCHVRKADNLFARDSEAKFIFLRRRLRDIFRSKINDGSLPRSIWKHWIHRLYALVYFSLSYVILSRKIAKYSQDALVLDYENICDKLQENTRKIESFLDLTSGSLWGNVQGKASSFAEKTSRDILVPNRLEHYVLNKTQELCEIRYTR
jgi:hypothetical protein